MVPVKQERVLMRCPAGQPRPGLRRWSGEAKVETLLGPPTQREAKAGEALCPSEGSRWARLALSGPEMNWARGTEAKPLTGRTKAGKCLRRTPAKFPKP